MLAESGLSGGVATTESYLNPGNGYWTTGFLVFKTENGGSRTNTYGSGAGTSSLCATFSGKSISWYTSGGNAFSQKNYANYRYDYVAIG